jgi:hypothetical protein
MGWSGPTFLSHRVCGADDPTGAARPQQLRGVVRYLPRPQQEPSLESKPLECGRHVCVCVCVCG